MNLAVGQVDKVTQQNAASSEESSSAAAELSGQSRQLAEMVGTFRLERTAAGAPNAKAPPHARANRPSSGKNLLSGAPASS